MSGGYETSGMLDLCECALSRTLYRDALLNYSTQRTRRSRDAEDPHRRSHLHVQRARTNFFWGLPLGTLLGAS